MAKKKETVKLEVRDEYVRKILILEKEHFKKHGNRRMSKKEMDALFGK